MMDRWVALRASVSLELFLFLDTSVACDSVKHILMRCFGNERMGMKASSSLAALNIVITEMRYMGIQMPTAMTKRL